MAVLGRSENAVVEVIGLCALVTACPHMTLMSNGSKITFIEVKRAASSFCAVAGILEDGAGHSLT